MVSQAGRQRLSAVAIAKNEERDIGAFLQNTLAFADEVVLVLDVSSDRTADIVREVEQQHGGRVIVVEQAMDPATGFAGLRNAGIDAASGDWLLHMDVDMRMTPEMAKEISVSIQGPARVAFRYRLIHHFLNAAMKGGAGQDWNNAWLARRGAHRFENVLHEVTVIDGTDEQIGQIESPMWHLADESYVERVRKNVQYMQGSGQRVIDRGIRVKWYHMVLHPVYKTFKTYVRQGAYRDGTRGFLLALHTFGGTFNWWAHAWDIQNRIPRATLESQLQGRWASSGQSVTPLPAPEAASGEILASGEIEESREAEIVAKLPKLVIATALPSPALNGLGTHAEDMDAVQAIQEDEYAYPYHYLPEQAGGTVRQFQYWGWGYQYLAGLDLIVDLIRQRPVESLIDVGCGDGRLLRELSERLPEAAVVGIDYSERAIGLARVMNPDLDYRVHDILEAPLGQTFDVVTLSEVLEHVPIDKTREFANALTQLMHKGSRLIITVPHANQKLNVKHYQHFTRESLEQTLGPAFNVTHWEFFDKESRLPNLWRRMLKNNVFVLNHGPTLQRIYNLYRRKYFKTTEADCKRLGAVVELA